MGSSARLTLVLLLIFVLGTALLLEGGDNKQPDKDGKKNGELAKGKASIEGAGSKFIWDQVDGGNPEAGGGSGLDLTSGNRGRAGERRQYPPRDIERNPNDGRVRPRQPKKPRETPKKRGGTARVDSGPAGSASLATVKPGDSWWRLAKRHLGSGNYHKQLAAANPGVRLQPGVKVRVPAVAGATRTVSTSGTKRGSTRRGHKTTRRSSKRLPATHVIQPGESLWVIAQRYYGKGHLHWVIADHNGLDEDRVRAGLKITIPAR